MIRSQKVKIWEGIRPIFIENLGTSWKVEFQYLRFFSSEGDLKLVSERAYRERDPPEGRSVIIIKFPLYVLLFLVRWVIALPLDPSVLKHGFTENFIR